MEEKKEVALWTDISSRRHQVTEERRTAATVEFKCRLTVLKVNFEMC